MPRVMASPNFSLRSAKRSTKENKFPCAPDQVIVTCGAKDAIYEGMEAVLNPGDEVLLLTPAWVSYEPCVQMAGGKIVKHAVNQKTFQLDDSILERVNDQHQDDRGQLAIEPVGRRL